MHAKLKSSSGSTGQPTAGAPPLGRTISLRTRLVLLVLAVLLPALALAALLILDSARQAYRMQERQLATTARTLSLVVDRQLSQQAGLLNALTVSRRLRDGDWQGFAAQARLALPGHDSWIVVRSPEGRQYVNTLLPAGAPLPQVSNSRVPPNRTPRPDGIRVSDLAMGAIAKEPVIVLVKAVPLTDGGEVDVSIVTRARTFSDLLRRQGLPRAWNGTILDGRYRIIARSRQEAQFLGESASPWMIERLRRDRAGLVSGKTLDGMPSRSAFAPVDNSDWTVVLALPRSELIGPAQRAFAVGAILSVALLALGVGMAARMGRTIARAVERLRAATAPLDSAAFQSPPPSGIPELDELARAFAYAAAGVREREDRQQLLINELNHRVKNTLATVQSIAKHSRAGAADVDQFQSALEGRVMAMSGAHELLTRRGWSSADLHELARQALQPFESPRLRISGPSVHIEPTDSLNLSMILYELATNAVKYGALSGETGAVDLSWTQEGDEVRVRWLESGGPAVTPPARQGFGSRLINRARETLQPSEYRHDAAGVRCSLTLQARRAA